ncbi:MULTISPECIES: hypothetical protein [unclassified Prochlorococcus]|uniref:hypothetical protein n=2 Tax=Prochlorococcus TaxID=1218 RepID=UPI000565495E|nr:MULTISPECIES: hypothetical protein [unclassified Prochlorococcus]
MVEYTSFDLLLFSFSTRSPVLAIRAHIATMPVVCKASCMEMNAGYIGLGLCFLVFAGLQFWWLGMTMGLFSKRRDLQIEFKPPREAGTNFKPQRDLSPISRDDEFKRRLEQTFAESPSQRED